MCLAVGAAPGGPRLRVVVDEVAAGGSGGRVASQLARGLREAFESRPCGVALAGPSEKLAEAQFELRVVLEKVEQAVRYTSSPAAPARNPDPDASSDYEARCEIEGRLEWRRLADGATVGRDRWRIARAGRPRLPGEDASAVVRAEAVAELAREIRRRTCRLRALR